MTFQALMGGEEGNGGDAVELPPQGPSQTPELSGTDPGSCLCHPRGPFDPVPSWQSLLILHLSLESSTKLDGKSCLVHTVVPVKVSMIGIRTGVGQCQRPSKPRGNTYTPC